MADPDVSAETFELGLNMCRKFLTGCWRLITSDDISISRVRGGTSNLLYVVKLCDSVRKVGEEPRKVLLRIYGQIIKEDPQNVVKDCVVYSLLAEKRFGPKLYGVFEGGRVEEYIENIPLNSEDLHKPHISQACARLLANFHKLQMPLNKNPTWYFETVNKYVKNVMENTSFESDDPKKASMLEKIRSFNIEAEAKKLRDLWERVPSPIVFSHNDFQEGCFALMVSGLNTRIDFVENILYWKSETSDEWKLIPIDCEYASYSYRAYDIGNLFCEWCINYKWDDPPYFQCKLECFPTKEQQLIFLTEYVKELDPSNTDVMSTAESMLREVAAYRLGSHFLWGVWAVVQDRISDINFGYLDFALARLESYFIQKKEFLEQYGINEL